MTHPTPSSLPPPGMPEDATTTHTKLGLYLLANYLLLLAVFAWLLVFSPRTLAADTLPLPGDRELFLFGDNLAMVYGAVLVFMPIIFALGFVNPRRSRRA